MSGRPRADRLEDRVDEALRAMWAGDAGMLSALFGGASGAGPSRAEPGDDTGGSPSGVVELLRRSRETPRPRVVLAPGARVGRYTIVALLGEGGMGSVYEAEQDSPRRRVALKILRDGWQRDGLAERWLAREADALARLPHPNIARIFEAGVDGERPFLSMEKVDGLPIDRHAEDRDLDPMGRVELFTGVVEAVAAAHRRGVIHRDLKPSNVLVTPEGTPKVLDFGLARLELEGGGEAVGGDPRSRLTRADTRAGTLPYMSPEQIRGDARDVDVRTDVYSLGVMLFELLTRRLPHDLPDSRYDAERVIVEADALRLRAIAPRLDRDLDAVVARALAKDRDRRYASAEAFLDDLRRYVQGLPVTARPPELRDHVVRLVRRHPWASAGAVGAAVLLLVAFVMTIAALGRARRAESAALDAAARTREQARRAAAVGDFLSDLIEPSNPDRSSPDRSLRDVLREAAATLSARVDLDAAAQATVHGTVGRALQGLGDLEGARVHLTRALDLRRALHAGPHADLATSLRDLAFLDHADSRFDSAERGHREALEMRRALFGEADPRTFQSREELARVVHHRGRWAEARTLLEEGLGAARASGRADLRFDALCDLGDILVESYEPAAGAEVLQEALELALGSAVLDPVESGERARHALARARLGQRDLEAAERLLEENVAAQRARLGDDDPHLADSLDRLGFVCSQRGDLERAEALLREAARIREARFGPTSALTLTTWMRAVKVVSDSGRVDEALTVLDALLARGAAALGPDHPQVAAVQVARSQALFESGRREEGVREAGAALASLSALVGPDHFETVKAGLTFANQLQSMGDASRARREFERALAACRAGGRGDTLLAEGALTGLAGTNAELGDHAAAATWFGELAELWGRHFGDHPQVAEALLFRAREERAAGRSYEAEASVRAARDVLRRSGAGEERLSPAARSVLDGG